MRVLWLLTGALATLSLGCGNDPADPSGRVEPLTIEELMDPESCKDCHPNHYREWKSSMHAYAADDPVFLAMNQRGQEETGGELGRFCVNCHAPMAVIEGATVDGSELSDPNFPQHLKGVTCYFCHNAVDVESDHNNGTVIARDNVMRASLDNPVDPGAHGVEYSELLDRNSEAGTRMCGGCHDIVTDAGVHLERTFAEYKESVFASGIAFDTCIDCHMNSRDGLAADVPELQVPGRRVSEHLWAGVDVALTPWPDRELYQTAVECKLQESAVVTSITASDPVGGVFEVAVQHDAGHHQPSGAAQDRRLWIEFIAYGADDEILCQSGLIADDEIVDQERPDVRDCGRVQDGPGKDSGLWLMRDWIYNEDGEEVHMFWEAAEVESRLLPFARQIQATSDQPIPPHDVSQTYVVGTTPTRVTAQIKMRPMGLEVLHDLVDSGHLDPAIVGEMPTFTHDGSMMVWTPDDGATPVTRREPGQLECPEDYLCQLHPDAQLCQRQR